MNNQSLEEVSAELQNIVATDSPSLRPIVEYFLQATGKGTRPLLVLLCGEIASVPKRQSIDLAVAVELLHMASLVHDDIVDKSSIRRNQPTVNSLFGDKTAVLVGDYFFGKMLSIISRYPFAIPCFSDIIQNLVAGEFMQMDQKNDPWLDEELYFERIYRKTGNFIAACCRVGSLTDGAPEHTTEFLTNYGYYLGMAYQLLDDLHDIVSTSSIIGKPVQQDAASGIYSLPYLHAIQNSLVSISFLDEHPLPKESISYSIEAASNYIKKSLISLHHFPNSDAKKGLQILALHLKTQLAKFKEGIYDAPPIH